MIITEEAYAKVNLSLNVLGRRPNGYHDVSMIMQSVDLHDTLTFEKAESGIILVTDSGELNSESEEGKENLIVKAARALFAFVGKEYGVKITLTKRIPIAAGMAGGSTDAAATLRGLNRLLELGLTDEELEDIGGSFGADIPFCIKGGTQLSEGIGEILTALPSPKKTALIIVKPPVNISTKEVYEKFDALDNPDHPDVASMRAAIEKGEFEKITGLMGNSLEAVTRKLYPRIGEIEEFLMNNGAIIAMMSGSGPTVFALVDENKQTSLEALAVKEFSDCYVKGHFYGRD